MNALKKVSRICCVKEPHFSFKDTNSLKVSSGKRCSMQMVTKIEQEWLYLQKIKQIFFHSKLVTRDIEGHYILIKLSVHQFATTAVTWRTLCYMKLTRERQILHDLIYMCSHTKAVLIESRNQRVGKQLPGAGSWWGKKGRSWSKGTKFQLCDE